MSKTQLELANTIQKEMEEIGYKLLPDLSRVGELKDTSDWDDEKKKAYYQNLAKIGLEQAFSSMMVDVMGELNKAQENG